MLTVGYWMKRQRSFYSDICMPICSKISKKPWISKSSLIFFAAVLRRLAPQCTHTHTHTLQPYLIGLLCNAHILPSHWSVHILPPFILLNVHPECASATSPRAFKVATVPHIRIDTTNVFFPPNWYLCVRLCHHWKLPAPALSGTDNCLLNLHIRQNG